MNAISKNEMAFFVKGEKEGLMLRERDVMRID
jgi:hypothetical protein